MRPIESGVEAWNISGLAAHRDKTFLPPCVPLCRSPSAALFLILEKSNSACP
jgi:hypothetical protein